MAKLFLFLFYRQENIDTDADINWRHFKHIADGDA